MKVRKSRFHELSSRSQIELFRKCASLLFLIILYSNLLVSSSPYEHGKMKESQKESSYLLIPRAEAMDMDDLVIGGGEELIVEDQALTPQGDIVVEEGGRLVLRGVDITFNHTGFYEHGILLEDGSTIEIHDSQITGLDNLFYFRAHSASITIENTTFRHTHLICSGATQITVRDSHIWALHCLNDTRVDALDADLSYLLLMGDSSARIDRAQMIEIILYDRSHVSVSNTRLRFIFYFDDGTATITDCDYEDDIRFEPNLCELTIHVRDEETLELIPAVDVHLNRTKGYVDIISQTGDEGTAYFRDIEEGDYLVELASEGYEPYRTRISVLNETQQVTLLMCKLEEPDGGNNGDPLQVAAPYIFTIAFALLFLGIIFRGQVKNAVDWLL